MKRYIKQVQSPNDTRLTMTAQDLQQEREFIQKEIFRHEQLVMAACGFEFDIQLVNPLVERYMQVLYPNHFSSKSSPLRILAISVANDSCFTYANLVYSTQSVAMACVIFSASLQGLPMMFAEETPTNHVLD